VDGCNSLDSIFLDFDNLNTITGTIFFDQNQDGQLDSVIDFGQAGVRVYLYDDIDSNAIVSSADILIDSTISSIGGGYQFLDPFSGGAEYFVIKVSGLNYPENAFNTTDDIELTEFRATKLTDVGNDFGFSVDDCSSHAGNVIEENGANNPLNILKTSDGEFAELSFGESITVDLYNYLSNSDSVQFNVASRSSMSSATVVVRESKDGIVYSNMGVLLISSLNIDSFFLDVQIDSARFIKIENAGSVSVLLDAIDYDCGPYVKPVPVEWLSFSAIYQETHSVLLQWSCASEESNNYFTIERSHDGLEFKDILGVVNGAGTSAETTSYSFVDQNPYKGVNYYRLRQTDYNGRYDFSELQVVQLFDYKSLFAYPNPSQGTLNVLIPGSAVGRELVVLDLAGNIVMVKELEET